MCRSPGYQLYVAQRVVREGVDAIPLASVTDRTPLLPMYRKQDVGLPLTITQHEYTSGPLAGYFGNCTIFQLFQKLLVNDRTRWDVSVVEYGVIDSERSEVFADGVKLIGSIVDGVKISDAAPPGFDDVGSAFKMLQRTGKKDATLPCEKTPASKHKVAAAVPEHVVVNPEVAHIHQLFQDLFVATNDYEADLLRELRLEMGEDDIDEELSHIGKPKATKLKKGEKPEKVAKAAKVDPTDCKPIGVDFAKMAVFFPHVSRLSNPNSPMAPVPS